MYDSPVADQESGFEQVVPHAKEVRRRALEAAKGKKPKAKPPKSVSRSPSRILAMEKQRRALELRKGGASYADIAKAVGYKDQSGARKAVIKAFGQIHQEPAAETKTLQIERLNHMLLVLWPRIQSGDDSAINTGLRVMDKIDRLMGTEAAQTVDVHMTSQSAVLVVEGNKDDYIAQMKRMVGITADGTNKPDPIAITSTPATPDQTDVVDAEVMLGDTLTDQDIETIQKIMAPPTEKKFDFGMEPKRKEKK